jgi:imidazole glycerol phosphate synthase subunit HisF
LAEEGAVAGYDIETAHAFCADSNSTVFAIGGCAFVAEAVVEVISG